MRSQPGARRGFLRPRTMGGAAAGLADLPTTGRGALAQAGGLPRAVLRGAAVGMRSQPGARRGFLRPRTMGGAAAGLADLPTTGRGALAQAGGLPRAVLRGAAGGDRGTDHKILAGLEQRRWDGARSSLARILGTPGRIAGACAALGGAAGRHWQFGK